MVLVSIFKDTGKFTRILSEEQYDKQKGFILGHYTVEVRNEDGEVIDSNKDTN